MLTISEVADFAGVTVRAVRHYHQRGLLPEPPRDASGYRRYDADSVLALIRIRTLAQAGVPLSRVADLLQADDEEFTAAVAEIEAELHERQREIARHRDQVRRLVAADSLALPPVVVAYLDRLRALGISEETVRTERDGWILLNARHPGRVAGWIALKDEHLDHDWYVDMYVAFDRCRHWDADDPRLEAVATGMLAVLTRLSEQSDEVREANAEIEHGVIALLDEQTVDSSPAWTRVRELIEEHGWTGWNDVRPAVEQADGGRGTGDPSAPDGSAVGSRSTTAG